MLGLESSRGGSAQTFRGLLKYLRSKRPAFILYENVDSLEESSQSGPTNQDILMSELLALGYQGQPTICEASKFGLPCRRRRCYIFFVQMNSNTLVDFRQRSVRDIFENFKMFLATCMREGPSLDHVLLSEDDEAVMSELSARKEKQKQTQAAAANSAAATAGKLPDWPEAHMKFAAELHVPWTQTRADLQSNEWYRTLSARERNALPLLQIQMAAQMCMVRDLSQSIPRANNNTWQADAGRHVGPTLLSKQTLWLEPCDGVTREWTQARLMLGREALHLQGFPALTMLEELKKIQEDQAKMQVPGTADRTQSGSGEKVRTLSGKQFLPPQGFPSEALLMDLAGNGMSLPVLLAVLQSALSSIVWDQAEVEAPLAQVDEVRVACEALDLLQTGATPEASSSQTGQPKGLLKKRRRV